MYPKTIEFDNSIEFFLPQIISGIPITKNVENHCSDVMLLSFNSRWHCFLAPVAIKLLFKF